MAQPVPRNEWSPSVQGLATDEFPIAGPGEPKEDHCIIKWVPCDIITPCAACRARMDEEAATSRSESAFAIPNSPFATVVPYSTAVPATPTASIVDQRVHEDRSEEGPSKLLLPEIACLSADDATETEGDVDAGDASEDEEDSNTYQLISSDDDGDHTNSGQDPEWEEEHPQENPRDATAPPTAHKRVRFARLQPRRSFNSTEDESESRDDEYRPPQPLPRNRRLQMKLRKRSAAKRARRN